MLEGGGKTPILNPIELEEIGYKLVAYPLSLIGVSIRAMQVRYLHLLFVMHMKAHLILCNIYRLTPIVLIYTFDTCLT